MTVSAKVASRQRELEEQRQAFVRATVVRTQRPTSATPGDVAVVDALGVMTGFVGGTCVEASVREYSLAALESGEPLLLQVRPGEVGKVEHDGAVEVHNPCLSGGSIDVFLEPVTPAAHVVVVGEAPIAQALSRLGAELGFDMELVDGEAWHPADATAALIVAGHGRGEEPALEKALAAGIPYIGLVASRKRGTAVVASLNVSDALRDRVRTPAGLDLGGTTPAEIALAVLAELVQTRAERSGGTAVGVDAAPAAVPGREHADAHDRDAHAHDAGAQDAGAHDAPRITPSEPSAPATAIDPVCGMTVVAAEPTLHTEHEGKTVWFCAPGCRARFIKEPERYAVA
ncbi:XdhC family protein [Microbacterium hominis]|uniref:XdhC family protein n=1 Tax=Microbacterium hominis TaxID=162426 RepID=A0A7D4Q217_9MICO|nr:XdhC family protein [Microbacterium hominis]QKJ20258.1 XdhC family protein [Microbacterium hominis]